MTVLKRVPRFTHTYQGHVTVRGCALKAILIPVPLLLAMSLAACTAEQAYYSGQAWQRNQCSKLPDRAKVNRCMEDANTTYDSYKQQSESDRK